MTYTPKIQVDFALNRIVVHLVLVTRSKAGPGDQAMTRSIAGPGDQAMTRSIAGPGDQANIGTASGTC